MHMPESTIHREDQNIETKCLYTEPLPLMDLCRRSIRSALGRQRLRDIDSLPLPQSLKNYLQYQ
ncbi:SPRY domain-containing SOCS box protein 4 [Cricetulus griseus]|uniref:SPRY domain-containing SOCS box protein 4 n=1 Tax=Cricetulus griseus TaxID=10029 RepID=G3GSX5_CRIGR|nr:SPRY domain-containing SOCS box protein 4 [Cricetulus griseus]